MSNFVSSRIHKLFLETKKISYPGKRICVYFVRHIECKYPARCKKMSNFVSNQTCKLFLETNKISYPRKKICVYFVRQIECKLISCKMR